MALFLSEIKLSGTWKMNDDNRSFDISAERNTFSYKIILLSVDELIIPSKNGEFDVGSKFWKIQ